MTWRFPDNGYQAEWAHLADAAQGRGPLPIAVADAADDMLFALALADGCDQVLAAAA